MEVNFIRVTEIMIDYKKFLVFLFFFLQLFDLERVHISSLTNKGFLIAFEDQWPHWDRITQIYQTLQHQQI